MSERLNSFTRLMVYLGGAKMYMASDPTPFMDDAQEYVAQLEAQVEALGRALDGLLKQEYMDEDHRLGGIAVSYEKFKQDFLDDLLEASDD